MTCIFSFPPQLLHCLGQREMLSLHQHLYCRLPSTPLSVVMLDCYCNSKARMVGMDVMDPKGLLDPGDQRDPRDQQDPKDQLDFMDVMDPMDVMDFRDQLDLLV